LLLVLVCHPLEVEAAYGSEHGEPAYGAGYGERNSYYAGNNLEPALANFNLRGKKN
jgi:hypothetical protein